MTAKPLAAVVTSLVERLTYHFQTRDRFPIYWNEIRMLRGGTFLRSVVRVACTKRAPSTNSVTNSAHIRFFATSPAAEPTRPPPLRHVIYYDVRDFFVRQYRRARVIFVVSAVLGACVVANVLGALERGVVGGNWPGDSSSTVKRAYLNEQLKQLLRPQATCHYGIVMGAHGTGKSTAIRKAARDSSTGRINGVVYYLVEYPATFSTGLAGLLGCREATVDVTGGIRRLLSQVTKEEKLPAAKEEPRATWLQLYPQLLEGSAAFRRKHGRPATLVLDGVDVIAKEDPAFLDMLQIFAKNAADAGTMRVIFVSSDGTAPTRLESRSEWSRAANPLEVGDISDEEAVNFLVNVKRAKPSVAGACLHEGGCAVYHVCHTQRSWPT